MSDPNESEARPTPSDKGAGGGRRPSVCSPRFVAVSDGDEASVYDNELGYDIFPTRSGNRDYQCPDGCHWQVAEEIALAMNVYHLTMQEDACYSVGNEEGARRCRREVFRLCGFGENDQ